MNNMLCQTMLKLALIVISADLIFPLGEFRRIRLQQSVAIKDVLSVEKTSVTQCHLHCHSLSACAGYGSQNMDSGELFIHCHLLKRGYDTPLTEGERIRLDVVEMVGFKFRSEKSVGDVHCLNWKLGTGLFLRIFP